ncbi:type II secretion system protein [Colwellia sp. M166]|jgi:MSHA pilin protein MshB|uniref:prepilin-type N-terminal cleavage/methylation domain-containing protein n=1 Tax=Colwellia sp. M166 TaxID=2583805 RepID=UPI002209F16D|nr:type II secretion system protein [Colwellia sp. M166]UUO24087.1 type II secretion system protein [Colwellia sp. M166]|tara:strand:- start:759 stop:1382 length:624 start_codon:yes stop_codon:yes gene_type:complete
MRKQSGFTLIELVIVVVILGFLAVTAIPKFLDLTDQAKQANIEGMAGGFATAISLARAQWEAEGRPTDGTNRNVVSYDGADLVLTTEATGIRPGYVVSSVAGRNNNGAGLGTGFTSANCVDIWQNIFQQPPRITNAIATINSDSSMDYLAAKSGSGASTLCHFYLKETLNKSGDNYTDPGTATDTGNTNSFTYQPANSSVVVYINNN